MLFEYSEKSRQLQSQLGAFMDKHIYPNERAYTAQLHESKNRFAALPLMDELKSKAKANRSVEFVCAGGSCRFLQPWWPE